MSTELVTKGNLLHWYKPGYAHFVTYRLAGSIPKRLILQWREERLIGMQKLESENVGNADARQRLQKLFYKKFDDYLDQSTSIKWLANPSVADIIRENLYHHHGTLYQLLSWCVRSNHVHVLIQPIEKFSQLRNLNVERMGFQMKSQTQIVRCRESCTA